MKSNLRNPGYIKVSMGLINEDAQNDAKMNDTYSSSYNTLYFSKSDRLFELGKNKLTKDDAYATLETNFIRVNSGSNRCSFPPRENDITSKIWDKGRVGKSLSGTMYARIQFNSVQSFSGMQIEFGYNYPVDFYIYDVTNSKRIVTVTDNTSSTWVTDATFTDTKILRITVTKMKNTGNRLRIYNITCGRGLIFENNDVITSTLSSVISPMSETLPQDDFSVTVKNYDGLYNYDNPNSIINFFDTGQKLTLEYGYELDSGNIEWFTKGVYYCSEWTADDTSCTIYATDVLRTTNASEVIYDYTAYAEVKNRTLAVWASVIGDGGDIVSSTRDGVINKFRTKIAPGSVERREALQIIANAAAVSIIPNPSKGIDMMSLDDPENLTAESNNETVFSNVSDIVNAGTKYKYAFFGKDYIRVSSNQMRFPPKTDSSLYGGYISESLSDENGDFVFDDAPTITVSFDTQVKAHQLKLTFGDVLPKSIYWWAYHGSGKVDEGEITDGINKELTIYFNLEKNKLVDNIKIMSGLIEPYTRLVIHRAEVYNTLDFIMEKNDMLSSPSCEKREVVNLIKLPLYTYKYFSDTEKEIVYEETGITVEKGEEQWVYTDNVINFIGYTHNQSSADFVTIAVYQRAMKITFNSNVSNLNLTITAMVLKKEPTYLKSESTGRGSEVIWDNPMITTRDNAEYLLKKLRDYYNRIITYEYDYRGNPELDVGDTIIQENDFVENMRVDVIEHAITFNGAFSGHIKTLRK